MPKILTFFQKNMLRQRFIGFLTFFKKSMLRRRFIGVFVGSFIGLFLLWAIDPTNTATQGLIQEGGGFLITLAILLKTCVYLGMLHVGRKILFDYIDLGDIYDKVMGEVDGFGAGLFAISIGLWAIAIAIIIGVSAFA